MFKLDLEKAEGAEIKLPTTTGSLTSALLTIHCMDHNELWKILQEIGIPDHLTCLLRSLYAGQEATVKPDMKQQIGSKLGKEYVKAVFCHPAYLTSTQSTSHKMPHWMKHKMESRLLGETAITSDMHMTPPLWQKVKN